MTDRPDSFDTKAFLEFCRSKPRGERFSYYSTRGCALGQFLNAQGIKHRGVGGTYWADEKDVEHRLDPKLETALALEPSAFGALADRLAKLVEAK